MASNYTFSHPASPDDIHGSTSWHQEMAGSGRHTERVKRCQATRAAQLYELPVMTSPLANVEPFVDEYRRNYVPHVSVARNAIVGGVLGAAIVHYARRGR